MRWTGGPVQHVEVGGVGDGMGKGRKKARSKRRRFGSPTQKTCVQRPSLGLSVIGFLSCLNPPFWLMQKNWQSGFQVNRSLESLSQAFHTQDLCSPGSLTLVLRAASATSVQTGRRLLRSAVPSPSEM